MNKTENTPEERHEFTKRQARTALTSLFHIIQRINVALILDRKIEGELFDDLDENFAHAAACIREYMRPISSGPE